MKEKGGRSSLGRRTHSDLNEVDAELREREVSSIETFASCYDNALFSERREGC